MVWTALHPPARIGDDDDGTYPNVIVREWLFEPHGPVAIGPWVAFLLGAAVVLRHKVGQSDTPSGWSEMWPLNAASLYAVTTYWMFTQPTAGANIGAGAIALAGTLLVPGLVLVSTGRLVRARRVKVRRSGESTP